ncbi:NAD(P)-dependent oxidoreductase [Mycobacterium sp. Aquia_216]|uniref:NAD(P)-dependent oxidoreductase n=1 Tax=Mycobacterium sp. Aquia_216 TaxID=2991729 RepID=UPI00227B6147|nr:NAD(P)-dependent oxidoreductase [Mycobacterium sp. Aquia_216]WAJ44273.1 NAD(P)-dependent oxidoreductase [Mycobacterium sp. Aquia_216]
MDSAGLRVGFIGLGNFGEPMATRVALAGLDLVVFDLRDEPMTRLERCGARSVASVESMAQSCDIIQIAVVNDQQVTNLLIGDAESPGIIERAASGSIILVHSTIHPDTCRRLSAVAATKRIEVLDAPVTGGPAAAASGALSVMVGGSAAAVETCRPVLDAIGTTITHLGASGAGQLAKLANNIGIAMTMRAVHESLSFASANGIPADQMLGLLGHGAASSWVAENWLTIGHTAAHYQAGGVQGVADLTYKDLWLALSIAHDSRLALPGAALAAQLIAEPYCAAAELNGLYADPNLGCVSEMSAAPAADNHSWGRAQE